MFFPAHSNHATPCAYLGAFSHVWPSLRCSSRDENQAYHSSTINMRVTPTPSLLLSAPPLISLIRCTSVPVTCLHSFFRSPPAFTSDWRARFISICLLFSGDRSPSIIRSALFLSMFNYLPLHTLLKIPSHVGVVWDFARSSFIFLFLTIFISDFAFCLFLSSRPSRTSFPFLSHGPFSFLLSGGGR